MRTQSLVNSDWLAKNRHHHEIEDAQFLDSVLMIYQMQMQLH